MSQPASWQGMTNQNVKCQRKNLDEISDYGIPPPPLHFNAPLSLSIRHSLFDIRHSSIPSFPVPVAFSGFYAFNKNGDELLVFVNAVIE